MANVTPPNFATPVGKWRLLTGDVTYDSSNNYTFWQDDEIEAYLSMYSDVPIERAIGYAYMGIAAQYANEAEMVKTYDLQIDSRNKASAMTAVAKMWFDRADEIDEEAGVSSALYYVPLAGDEECSCVPEAAVWPVRMKCKCG